MPTPTVTKKADLAYRAGTSDKVYHVWVENVGANHFVKFRYGRRGSTLNEGTKVGPTDTASAIREFEKIVSEKLGKGYKPISAAKSDSAFRDAIKKGRNDRAA
jgi:bifunctional non-homologous end joining protein LigD